MVKKLIYTYLIAGSNICFCMAPQEKHIYPRLPEIKPFLIRKLLEDPEIDQRYKDRFNFVWDFLLEERSKSCANLTFNIKTAQN